MFPMAITLIIIIFLRLHSLDLFNLRYYPQKHCSYNRNHAKKPNGQNHMNIFVISLDKLKRMNAP